MNKEFKRGFKSAFSIVAHDRTRKRIPKLSTEDRIRRNWNNIGNDLRKSMSKIDSELKYVKKVVKIQKQSQ